MAVDWGLVGRGFDPMEALQIAGQAALQRHQRDLQAQHIRATQAATQALRSGDYDGAQQVAIESGDWDLAKQIGSLSDAHRERAGKEAETLGRVAAGLRQLPVQQRQAAFQSYAPHLMEQGFGAHELDDADLSDQGLDAYINLSRSVGDTLESHRVKYQAVPAGGYLQGFDATTGAPIGNVNTQAPVSQGRPQVGSVVAAPWAGGAPSQGGATFSAAMNALIQQESGGRAGAVGPQTQYGRAAGLAQLLPSTARGVAASTGVPYREDLLTGTTPEAASYQRRLGEAYLTEGLNKTGNWRDAFRYYHGGPNRAQWGPKTNAYADAVLARIGGG